jgi:FkbM family methyltransferase
VSTNIAAIESLAAPGPDLAAAVEANTKQLMELLHLQRFALLGPARVVQLVFEHHKIDVFVPQGDIDYIQRKLIANRSFYELANLIQIRKVIGEGAVIADIGANIGNHTLFFAICCQAAHVFAFEPVATNFEILARNIELNRLHNVTLFDRPVGLAGQRGAISSFKIRNSGATVVERSSSGKLKYMSLDDVEFPRLDLVKIDVEGQQLDVIRGSEQTLKRLRPKVMIEMREAELGATKAALEAIGMQMRTKIGGFDYLFEFA